MKKINFDFNKVKDFMNLDINDLKAKLAKVNEKSKSLKVKKEKKRKVVAFDIGSTNIKIAEGTYYKGILSIEKLIDIPTPAEAIIDGNIEKKELLVSILQKALNENGINAKEGICTNNSSLIINREILIPDVKDEELDTVVRYEIQQYLPINLDDYVLQMTKIGEEFSDEGKKLEIRAIAYPEKMAKGYYDLLMNLNLKPFALDVNYNALNKLLNHIEVINNHKVNSEESLVFIDMGSTSLDVNIYNNGVLKFTRIIKAGGKYLDEILYENMNIPIEEIEKFKSHDIDLKEEELEFQNQIIIDTLDEWIDKIEKIIQFYKSKNFDDDINKIFIYGRTSRIKNLEQYITSKIGIETIKIRNIPEIINDSNIEVDENIDNFINVIGSLIRL
ncbi:pilus assembly protein PilM [Clostridium botulinum]|uniref:Pilus assembly protein PilM n=1 Tax=Clostridium botulinum TaxID=1491 RepID=A0A6B4JQE7_CLOBO|nr:pilus assembly protein PilM [Clostridium botulinum]EES47885.1 type IV pilus assembly protein PilM [Clostridium botulinum E1 str. 'BoNT E Beluga']MBY6759428.1 pilus assembly protein PilM [Clostridium botulinum]MBY6918336.1 pilus assembly protein PilM [Clostridium botulinum]MCR1129420.1 pilus assembly protein PilM [Clostridium botulinum]NFJ59213.1 pilus assembly protein PilM [Clostridium botulinum]